MNNYKNKKKFKTKTKLILSGREIKKENSFVNPPISKGSTVTFKSVKEMKDSIAIKNSQTLTYGRFGSNTTFKLEKAITNIEEGYTTVATSSGTAAIIASLLSTLKSGDHLLMTDSAYAAAKYAAKYLLKNMGITTTFYNPLIGKDISQLIQKNTKVIYLESPGSLTFEIQDIPLIVDIASKNKCTTIMDNTWATPLYFKPISYGIDISIQAATKYINGHSDSMLGTITTNKKYADTIRKVTHSLGSCPGPEDIYLGLRGLKSLNIRLEQHKNNALRMIEWIIKQKEVENILYPAFEKFNGYKIWKRDFLGASGLFGITLKPIKKKTINKMLNNLKLFNMGFSWGGYESLILPVEPEKDRETYEWKHKYRTLRIHAGLEDVDDLIDDLKHGFKILRKD
tara:strand:- start:3389 stop:4582 length:1194 start_codon:yes stop_codon:yes gene_type:complete